MARSALRARIEWLLLFRVLLATLLLGSAIVVNVNNVASFSDGRYLALSGLIVLTYALSVIFGLVLRRTTRLEPLVYAQLLLDVGLISVVVAVTGGIESIFVFLYFLAVFNGANLLRQRGAFFAATAASLGLLALGIIQFATEPVAALSWLQVAGTDVRLPIYSITVHVFAFFIVAFLSGYLAEKLRSTGVALQQREQDVRSLRSLNEEIVRSVRSGILTTDAHGRVTLANRAAGQILGLRVDELVGRPMDDALPAIARAIAQPSADLQALPWTTPEGHQRALQLYAVPLADEDATPQDAGRLVSFQDVTALRALEAQVRRQAQLAAVGQLSASIAHEVRNPLAAISGAVELLQMDESDSPREARLKRIVHREVTRLDRLVEDFLAYARPREPERRNVDPAELVESVIESLRAQGSELPTLRVQDDRIDGSLRTLQVDPDLIRQVLWNLLRNAVQAAGSDGSVSVRVARGEAPPEAGDLVIAVEDSGPGLTPEARARIFEPFFTTREGGTGLGLATSLRLVAAHGGTLQVTEGALGGACFRVVLPTSVPHADGARTSTAWPPEPDEVTAALAGRSGSHALVPTTPEDPEQDHG
ncbi:MAG: PAS domain-containing protein [Deltaproteobacteria bacterium]|nr:MAG: PAS domain-containing protein [Deltaproteobacteria bacterium]